MRRSLLLTPFRCVLVFLLCGDESNSRSAPRQTSQPELRSIKSTHLLRHIVTAFRYKIAVRSNSVRILYTSRLCYAARTILSRLSDAQNSQNLIRSRFPPARPRGKEGSGPADVSRRPSGCLPSVVGGRPPLAQRRTETPKVIHNRRRTMCNG